MTPCGVKPMKLYGVKVSMFTGKARSYLIKQGIDFEEIAPVTEHFTKVVLPQIGRRIIPVIEAADGTIVQDTSDIIDYCEAEGLARLSAYPDDPFKKLIALILELFGDCGLIRPAMHYRWSFPEQTARFIRHGFGGFQGPDAGDEAKAAINKNIKKFSGYLPALGVNEDTREEVERAYIELLDLLDLHFERAPYVMGAQPNIGDYGMMCALFAHLGRDPVPAGLMKNHAPNLYRWTERMNAPHADISDMPYYAPSEALPETLQPLLTYIAKYFLPELRMNIEVMNNIVDVKSGQAATIMPKMSVLGFGTFNHGGVELQCAVRPITFHRLQRVTDCFAAMSVEEKTAAQDYLKSSGLAPLVTLTAKHRIAREGFMEVWG